MAITVGDTERLKALEEQIGAELQEAQKKLRETYPYINWDAPVYVKLKDAEVYGCRYCIGFEGLKPSDVPGMPATLDEFRKHMKEVHGR